MPAPFQPKAKHPLRGRASLLYALRHPDHGIDVGAQELDAVEILARWWGVAIKVSSLGHGGYRLRGAAPPIPSA